MDSLGASGTAAVVIPRPLTQQATAYRHATRRLVGHRDPATQHKKKVTKNVTARTVSLRLLSYVLRETAATGREGSFFMHVFKKKKAITAGVLGRRENT